jgi:lipoprotein-anchoring transpeptidase ErfK/SrfK
MTTDVESDDPPSLQLVASLSERQLYVKEHGETVRTYAVAVGKPKHPTPRGEFAIRRIVWNPGWVPPNTAWARNKKPKQPWDKGNPMKAVKIFFKAPDYYIHGTGDTESLGTAASHGCLRMAPSEAAELARMVMEHGGAVRDDTWFERIRSLGRTHTVRLPSPVTLQVVQ